MLVEDEICDHTEEAYSRPGLITALWVAMLWLNVKSTTIHTRASFDPCLLCVPPISKTCSNSFFDRSFVYAALTLWNPLDLDIRLLPFDAFKKRVKAHLYLKYFVN